MCVKGRWRIPQEGAVAGCADVRINRLQRNCIYLLSKREQAVLILLYWWSGLAVDDGAETRLFGVDELLAHGILREERTNQV